MRRREFLKVGVTLAAAGLVPWRLVLGGDEEPGIESGEEGCDHVAGAAAADTSANADGGRAVVWEIEGEPEDAVKSLFSALGGVGGLLDKKASEATVLIKPNMCLPHPARMGTTTSPGLVAALCLHLRGAGVKRVIVADHTLQQGGGFKDCDLIKAVDGIEGVEVVLANRKDLYEPLEIPGTMLRRTEVLKLLTQADLVINVATAKHHSATHVSLALKNLMGLIWNRSVFHTRFDLHQAIADLAVAVRPDLNIVDANRVLLNGGPTGPGRVTTDGRIFASRNILALDSVVTARYAFAGRRLDPRKVPHLVAAFKHGLGSVDVENIEVNRI